MMAVVKRKRLILLQLLMVNLQIHLHFQEISKGTTVTIEPGKYSVSEEVILDDYSTNLSTDCKGKLHLVI